MPISNRELHIYVNGRFLTQSTTGVQRFAQETVRSIDALLDSASPVKWTVLAPKRTVLKERWNHIDFATVGLLSGHAWEQFDLPRYASDGWLLTLSGAPSIFHSRHIFSIPDAAIYDMPKGYSPLYRAYYRILWTICTKRSKAILTFTEFSRSRLSTLFPDISGRIYVTSCGADHRSPLMEIADETPDNSRGDGVPVILAVSSMAPNKNFPVILKLSELLEDLNLKILVAGGTNPRIFRKAAHLPGRIEWLGYVSEFELGKLYRQADCFVFPSFYEGFGLPPIEAMRHGCPVIASDAASIPEVCGDAALYFDPHSVKELKSQLIRVLYEPGLADELRRKGIRQSAKYKWVDVARVITDLIYSLADPGSPTFR